LKLLLDSHVLLWWLDDPARRSDRMPVLVGERI
jgi:PIN domain nuclease of toxin-antitoxin system